MIESANLSDTFPVVAVIGPTATGKTAVSIRLATRLRGQIINLDSIQLYRRLDIGSAKPTRQERQMVRHHLIDIREPWDVMDAASFMRLAARAIERVVGHGCVPILVGGTGFYLKCLEQGLDMLPGAVPALRERIKQMIRQLGHERVHEILASLDEKRALAIHPKDTYRLIRSFEILLYTKHPRDQVESTALLPVRRYRFFKIGLMTKRERLYDRIDRRVDQMLEQGLIQEVSGLLGKGLDPGLKPLQSIGYRHIISYLMKEKELDQAIMEMKRDTRRYAKRQITWFKKEPGIRWFDPERLLNAPDIWKAVH